MIIPYGIGLRDHDRGVAAPKIADDRRAALYLSSLGSLNNQSFALIDCAREAQQQRLRVVTVVAEEEDRLFAGEPPRTGLDGKRLRALVGRLGDGQFDVIVAHIGDGMITIGAPSPVRQAEVTQ